MFRKHSSFAYVISRIRNTNRPKKKLDNVFQSNCSSHAELPTNLRKIEKRPKIRHKAVMHPALQMVFLLNFNLKKMGKKLLLLGRFNPFTPNIKEQILLSCPHTLLIKVLGRSY